MTNRQIRDLFSRNGKYHFARWAKPLSPVIFGVDDNSGELYADGLSMRFSGNAVWSNRTTAQPTFQIISNDTSGNITGQHISGSAQTTASFGKATIGGPVFNDVSSSYSAVN